MKTPQEKQNWLEESKIIDRYKKYHTPKGYEKILGREYRIGTKGHKIALENKKHANDLLKGEGRGGYSYSDIHKTPLKKLVAGAHGHEHHWDMSDPEKMPYCEDCGKPMDKADPKLWSRLADEADAEADRQMDK